MGTPAHVVGERLMIDCAISRYFGQPRITQRLALFGRNGELGRLK
jgi:hypothetical protein